MPHALRSGCLKEAHALTFCIPLSWREQGMKRLKSPPMQPIQLSADWRSSISVIGAGVGNGVGGAGVG